ncbi:M20/M25/M40 family metallo-hydrolase [Puteibacter caeruleilacunae]|nr:M20/M25/M40 family metallo-hydrolase [Puteibacter caeruleilacunae]
MMIKKILKYAGVLILVLIVVMVVNTLRLKSYQPDIDYNPTQINDDRVIERLQEAIRFKTVTYDNPFRYDSLQFESFHQYLRDNFPLLHQQFELKKINDYALLYKLEGSDAQLKPAILLAHQDVVPVDSAKWSCDPFGGINDGTFVWGRGTLDDKGSLMAILEAVEMQLANGYAPKRTLYLAFGNDEEVGGIGAQAIARYLKQQGVDAAFVLDEGLVITSGMVPMIDRPVALIGTSEKGYMSVKLSCQVEGGHSSTPQSNTAISVISDAIVALTQNRPTAQFCGPVNDFLDYLGPELAWPQRLVFANRWLFEPVILSIYQKTKAGNALVRTTTAPTVLKAGMKDNVLPDYGEAVINYRILPGLTTEELLKYVATTVNNPDIKIEQLGVVREPAPVSPIATEGFDLIAQSIKEQYSETLVMPTLMLASSDSRHYKEVSKNIYRFAPYQLVSEDLSRIHGNDERISIESYKNMIGFYYRLLSKL